MGGAEGNALGDEILSEACGVEEAALERRFDVLRHEIGAGERWLRCSERLPPYNRVRRLEFAALPKTISGKIRRVELRATEKVKRDNAEAGTETRGAYEFWLEDFKA